MKELIKKEILEFAEYCGEIWCEWYEGDIDDKNTLRIVSDNSKWIIHLNDFNKFHSYILWHYSSNVGDDKYHRQKSSQNIFYLIAEAISHDFHKIYKLPFHIEDFHRLESDFKKYYVRKKGEQLC